MKPQTLKESQKTSSGLGRRLKSEYEDELEFLAEIVEKRLEAINKGDLKGFKVGLTLSNTGKGMRGSKTRQSIIIEMSNIWRWCTRKGYDVSKLMFLDLGQGLLIFYKILLLHFQEAI